MEDLPDAPEAATSFHPPSHQLSPPPLVPFKSARSGSSLPLPLPEANEYEEQDEEARDKMNEGKYDSPGPQNKQTSSSHNSDRSGSRSSGSGSSSGRQSDPSVLTGSHFGSSSLSQSGTFGDIQFSQIDMMDDGSQPLPSDSTAAAFSTSSVTTQMSLTLSTSQQKAATMADEPSGTPPLTQVSPPQPTRTIGGAAAQLHAQQQRRAFYKQPVVKTLLPVNRKRTLPPAPIFTDSPPTPRQPEPESTPQPQRPVQPIQKEPEKKVAEVAQPSRPPSSAAARQFDALFSSSQPPPSRDNSVLTQAAAGVGGTTASAVPAQQPAPSKQTSQPQQPSSSSSSASSAAGSISAAPSPSRKRDIDPAARAKARRQREDRYRELYPQIKGDVEAANDLTNNDLVAVLCCQGLKNITTLNKPALLAKVLPFIIEDKLALPVVRAAGAAKAAELQGASASASKKLPNLALYATQPTTYSDDEGEPASLSQGNKRHKTKHASSQEQAVFEQPTAKAQQKPKPVQHAAAAVAEAGGNASAASSVSRSSALQPWVAPPLIFRDTKYLRPPCTDFPPYSPCSFILHAGSDVVVVAAEYLRFRVEHMFAINQLAALQSQQESQQRFVKARQTINSLAIPTGLVHAKVLSFYPIISEELSKQKPQHSGGGAACRGWNHPPPSPWCELTLQVTEGAFAGEHFTLFYIDASWTLPNDAPSERRQLTVHNCAPFLLDKTRYDQLRSYDWSVGELFQMPLVSYSTQTAAEQGEPMVPVAAAPSAANLVVVMRVGRIISIKPVFPPHIDPMNFAQSPYHALKVLWLTKQIEPGEKFVYDAVSCRAQRAVLSHLRRSDLIVVLCCSSCCVLRQWNQDIPCVSFWEILPHSAASDQLATCMAPIACPSHSEHGFKAALRRHITKILEEIYELGVSAAGARIGVLSAALRMLTTHSVVCSVAPAVASSTSVLSSSLIFVAHDHASQRIRGRSTAVHRGQSNTTTRQRPDSLEFVSHPVSVLLCLIVCSDL